ncbi:class I SAM-dependent methyltransferase [candidate division WOR-3 bacterium]|nr:class I SAM-dependent methyltransferase [candidate division WOR-3 bacterium]
MTFEELKFIYDSVVKRKGWDFSKIRYAREPVPWYYADVVRNYLNTSSQVLDIGTGGGERFLDLASNFGIGMGIDSDPTMIKTAKRNIPTSFKDRVHFKEMSGEDLKFPNDTFDIVLNRHAPVYPKEIIRIMRADGIFITEQVGPKNTQNICKVFGCGPGGEYEIDPEQNVDSFIEVFKNNGCTVILHDEYNVRYWFCDLESLIFWLKGIPIPEDFSIDKHRREVNLIITEFNTPKGIKTNEHRELLIVKCNEKLQ